MNIYETERLRLRQLNVRDVEDIISIWGNPEVMKYCGQFKVHDNEHYKDVITRYNKLFEDRGFTVFAIVEKVSGKLIGVSGFNPTETLNSMELIVHLNKDYWGRGYATEASKACIEYIQNNFKNVVIFASTDPRNQGSKNMLIKVGFIYKEDRWFDDTGQMEPYFELFIK